MDFEAIQYVCKLTPENQPSICHTEIKCNNCQQASEKPIYIKIENVNIKQLMKGGLLNWFS